jgi:hypothetical protein
MRKQSGVSFDTAIVYNSYSDNQISSSCNIISTEAMQFGCGCNQEAFLPHSLQRLDLMVTPTGLRFPEL